MKKRFLCIICLVLMEKANSQQWADSLPVKMSNYGLIKKPDLLFVHTDKHIYTNNEFIWFRAYLLRCGPDSFSHHHFLSVILVQADTRAPVMQQKFAMSNGLSAGSLQLPDSIVPGEYKLVAYSNIIGNDSLPVAIHTQDLSVRSLQQAGFIAVMNIEEDSSGKKDVTLTVRDKNTMLPVRNADLFLWIGINKTLSAKTDAKGLFRQHLPPLPPGTTIKARVKYQGDLTYLQKTLPEAITESQLNLHFYPEGGNLLSQAPCRIGWESRTGEGEPLAVKAVLFKNNNPVDTIGTDDMGLGIFNLLPDPASAYSVRVFNLPPGVRAKKDGYTLPPVLSKGMTLHVPMAVAGDSLQFRIYTAGYSLIKLVVHDFRTIFATHEFPAKADGRPVLLLLHKIPKGLIAVTLLDSLNRPLAERIFFAHYDTKAQVQIVPDKKIYEKRQKVTLQFHLKNNHVAAGGFASVSCAQANRYVNNKQQDIESFAFLQAEMQDLPAYSKGRGYNDTAYLENVLLVRGWRRYTWTALLTDSLQQPTFLSPVLSGKVVTDRGKIKKPVTVNLIGGNTFASTITTDAEGKFQFTYDQLLVPQDKKLWIHPGDKITADKNVAINDPFIAINNKVAATVHFQTINAERFSQYSQDLVLKDPAQVRQLAAVTVTAKIKKDESIFRVANACGDYVCAYNILNCSNHFGVAGNHPPVKGKLYKTSGGGTTVYWGCMPEENHQTVFQYEGIKIGKEFYAEDFSEKVTDNPEYISTLFWSPLLSFDKNGKAECTFYTSDIAGRFRILVNGITDNDLFFATGSFEVK